MISMPCRAIRSFVLRFVLPSEIGHVDLIDGIDENLVRTVLEA